MLVPHMFLKFQNDLIIAILYSLSIFNALTWPSGSDEKMMRMWLGRENVVGGL